MTNQEITYKVLEKLGVSWDMIVRKGRSNSKELTVGDLIQAILSEDTVTRASKLLGKGSQTLNRALEEHIVPLLGNSHGGNETWKYKFLVLVGLKYCSDCKELLPFEEFTKDKSKAQGKSTYCKKCRVRHNSIIYTKESTQEAHKRSHEKNHDAILARNAKYRAERNLRVPKWSDLEKIKYIYECCPEGCHVDHERPLKGELVSGLHVPENLQYLTAEENIRKGNRYEID